MPLPVRDLIGWVTMRESASAAHLAGAQAAVRRLAVAGVPIVVGTDAGNWDAIPYQFHGASTPREVELLGHAGLAPMDALGSATRVAAAMLGLEREIGTVEVGKRADLVIVRKDPLRTLRALRAVRWTVRDGTARTPREWMRAAGG